MTSFVVLSISWQLSLRAVRGSYMWSKLCSSLWPWFGASPGRASTGEENKTQLSRAILSSLSPCETNSWSSVWRKLIRVVVKIKTVSSAIFLLLTCHFFFPGLVFFQVHLCSTLGASEMSGCFMLLKLYVSKNVTSDDTFIEAHLGSC